MSAISLGAMVSAGNLFASAIETIKEEPKYLQLKSAVLSDDYRICLDIHLDTTKKIALKKEQQKAIIKSEIPNNINRLTFNDLGVEGVSSVEVGELTWSRCDESAASLSEKLPYARCLFSNATKGLMLESTEVKKGDIIATYGYAASVFAPESHYSFKLKTKLISFDVLERHILDLTRRGETVLENPTLELKTSETNKILEEKAKDVKDDIAVFRAVSVLYKANQQYGFARKALERFYGKRTSSIEAKKHYLALAWNVYQFKDLIQNGISQFITQLNDGKKIPKLMETLDAYERNVQQHYSINIDTFTKWCAGTRIDPNTAGFFKGFLDN